MIRSALLVIISLIEAQVFAQDINFSSEYNKISWPINLGVGGGITGDDGSYKRLALYHGGSISLQTGSNSPGISNSRLFVSSTGNIGIGTTSPLERLHVANGSIIATDPAFNSINVRMDGTQVPLLKFTRWTGGGSTQHNAYIEQFVNSSVGNEYSFGIGTGISYTGDQDYSLNRLTILMNGNVGIGANLLDEKLTVNGKIKAEEIQVVVDVPAEKLSKNLKEKMKSNQKLLLT